MTTGLRAGEIFGLDSYAYQKSERLLFVTGQKDKELKTRATKIRRDRLVPILPAGGARLERWLALPGEERDKLRNKRHADVLKVACKKAFPKDKWLKFHDLRHSYAIHLLNSGVSLGLVAQCLGDSEAVCAEA